MYEPYTTLPLPSKEYRALLGSAICVFNLNNQFVINNILRCGYTKSWYELVDQVSGELLKDVKKTISKNSNKDIEELFDDLVKMRNRIIHSFQCTYYTTDGPEQILRTKEKNKEHKQFYISESYLYDFIKMNEKLNHMLYKFNEEEIQKNYTK